ncbi:hypothetical protein [Amycolatopsis cihanbeyliensis]|uniref:Uncharacterized protein n=1 Tax=Amycolatopsis cihanbeyliensis TaxID=1128664 RepID=A0A542DJR9_AMYCI|nr:hypothetical protein [Amycolatopsis cihanbeyliensis]TQJ03333.1 hypothetical protein FB471_3089 [Amycolatopsis cihanbeyliensis]
MLYLLAIVGTVTVAILLWKAFGSERVGVPSRPTRPIRQAPVAPDDDPDFLRKLAEEQRRKPRDDENNS